MDIPVMRWCSKFEKSGITATISTEQRGSFLEDFEATLNENTFDFYCGFEEIPAQQTAQVGEAFIEEE